MDNTNKWIEDIMNEVNEREELAYDEMTEIVDGYFIGGNIYLDIDDDMDDNEPW